jgi:hypothetical protein
MKASAFPILARFTSATKQKTAVLQSRLVDNHGRRFVTERCHFGRAYWVDENELPNWQLSACRGTFLTLYHCWSYGFHSVGHTLRKAVRHDFAGIHVRAARTIRP